MRFFLIALAPLYLLLALGAQQPVNPCATGETPCDPHRPWMRGQIEKSCAMPAQVEALKRERPGRQVFACHCQHTCDPLNEHAGVTQDRGWDALCQARCNPANCQCPHPCES